ncbi:MAG: lysophospholipid acyltransferase family protein [Proteobacteria bacterium]|nr:lysophospholipid acyltransferase family protein [Pseudomonadota bacterium]
MSYVTRTRDALFGLYAWFVFGLCILFGLGCALLVPGVERRARWLAGTAKAIFVLSAVPLEVQGMQNLPGTDCVVVANHASYVDGLLLKAYLPGRFSFVIKGEMRNNAIVHFLLRRAGSRFVERDGSPASSRDARQIVKAAKSGQSLAMFPEGTFQQAPGLLRFHAGAFVAAVRGNMPIVPIVISGTRHLLPSEHDLPRFSRLRIDVLPPINPDHPAFANHRELAKLARQRILAVLDEPDLVAEEQTSSGAINEQ